MSAQDGYARWISLPVAALVCSTSFASVGGDAEHRSTDPVVLKTKAGTELVYAFASLPITESSGKTHRLLPLNTILYRGREVGDFVTFRFSVPKSGRFDILVSTFDYHGRATVSVSMDGKSLGSLDLYAPYAYLHSPRRVGRMELKRGDHVVTLRVTGRNRKSKNFNVAVDELRLRSVR